MNHENLSSGSSRFQPAIQRVLPHRSPFLLVDRVTELVPGKRISGTKHFSADDEACQGNFPDAPLVPGGIVMEMMTQLGAILVLEQPHMQGKVAVILHIPSARLLMPVRPGDTLRVEAEVVKLGDVFGELRGAAHQEGKLVAEGVMRFAVAETSGFLPQ